MKQTALPKPSALKVFDDVPDLIRDEKSHVVVSAGGRDRGPLVGKRAVHVVEEAEVSYEKERDPKRVSRVIDPLRDMHRRGLIRDEAFADGIRFQDDFDRAHLATSSGMRFDNLPASGRVSTDGGRTDSVVSARDAVWDAVKAVGGQHSVGGVALCQVVGLRKSFNEMSRDNGEHKSMWKGATMTALAVLGVYYQDLGYKRRSHTR